MAELFLFSIAESLITKLASSLYEEASRVIGVYDDLREFKRTLTLVKAVLLDADQKKEHNHELQEWLRQLKHVLSDAENVLDEFECETMRKKVVKAYGTAKTKVSHFFSTFNPLVFRYRMASQIKQIRNRLDKVAADRHKFGLQIIEVDTRVVHSREMTYSTVNDSDVIGRKHDKEKIIESLMQQNQNLTVIPIVGMGGLGKTTLVKTVFNDKRINESFPLKIWVCVSDDFDIKQLVIKIINSANNSAPASTDASAHQQNFKELDMEQLQNHLRNKLAEQKFLLVLDDVWNEVRVKWLELRNLIQVGAKGSKILVTTRSHSIASMMGTIHSHILEGLSFDDSLSLFNKWAFKEGEEEKYPDLIKVGREIVKKCGGVPLAIRTIGSMLFSKLEIDEWESVRDNDIWNLPQKKDDILPVLKLSYDQLPSHLRQCFALFSLYPKDYVFNSFKVSSLWVALGLLQSRNKNKSSTDVANQYLDELIARSFLQDYVDFGTWYYFQIHDLVHDLALYVAKDECMMVNSNIENIPENVQHLSFVENDLLVKYFTQNSVGMRTILFPIEGVGANCKAVLNICRSRYKYLRILDLSESTYEVLPWSIGKLRHLRYLSLCGNKKIKRVPDSICKLQSLLVLMLGECTELETLPKGLRNLINLQQLEITTKQSAFPEDDIAKLNALEVLVIKSCDNLESLFVGIKLPTLKTLMVLDCGSLKSLPLDIDHFPQLEILVIKECGNLELSKGHDSQNSNLRLKSVVLFCLPQLVTTLPCWLQGCANTLQSLFILHCEELEVLPEWLSTLSFLKSLIIRYCPKLMSLPNDIHLLTTLELLNVEGCPELCRKCQPLVGEYWPKISHIKRIFTGEPEDLQQELVEEDELEKEQEKEESFNNTEKC